MYFSPKSLSYLIILLLVGIFCTGVTMIPQEQEEAVLTVVTVADFEEFVRQTGYQTDAERYGWSFVQQDVYRYQVVKEATWQKPDGEHPPSSPNLPVTQVSYQDALAYCSWAGARLPTYSEYWDLISKDKRKVVSQSNAPFSEANAVNVLGNVWEITATLVNHTVRLAGGSRLCSPTTCHGTSPERKLYVDQQTGNIHIGFAVVYP
ncbi:MAG: SUMF1/EgtB/PvdO family nonheme iron enzyme [Bacteroidota bacterium]